tara:strand:- start:20087 stop:21226 length:1140 start_codon:yes stop_codon:yes gene_type:complete
MRIAIIILSTFFSGSILAQNQEPIEESIKESEINVESITISKDKKKTIRSRKAKTLDAKQNYSTSSSESQKFKSYKAASSIQRTQRSPSSAQQSRMDEAVNSLGLLAPNSFEYHYFKYTAGNYNLSLVSHLNEAEKLRPDNVDVLIHKTAYNIILGKKNESIAYANRVYASGRLSKSVVDYAEDILLSVPQNGTLITHGFDDFYGAFYSQGVNNVRPDVQIISLELLQSEEYRNRLKKKGYVIPSNKIVDVEFFKKLCSDNSTKNISVSVTTPKEYLRTISKNLFLTGLVMIYSNTPKENFVENEKLWNTTLKKKLISNASNQKAKQLSANYLPMLFILRKGYNSTSNKLKVKEIDLVMDKISVQSNKYNQVQKLKSSY